MRADSCFNRAIIPSLVILVGVLGPECAPASDSAPSLVKQLNEQLADVADRISQSVVVISVDKPNWGVGDDFAPESMREYAAPPRFNARRRPPEGQGSGFILRKDGYILTNYHVVEGAGQIRVKLKNGNTYEATLRGTDDKTDLAVIKIEADDLSPAPLSNSDKVRVGELVMAIGAPYSLDYSVTVGVVSQKNRSGLGVASYEDFIQTDAKINPGNSGGPLVNIDGEVIGVNTLIRGLRTDIGFAIPVNMAREIAETLIREGRIVRSWVGVGFKYLSADKQLQEFLHGTGNEIVVDMLHPNAPAASSDLRPTDLIETVNGVQITTPREIQNEIVKLPIGAKVEFGIRRDGKPGKVILQTAELPTESARPSPVPPLPTRARLSKDPVGIKVEPIGKLPADQFDLKESKGVFITRTEDGGLGELAGLQHGDIIVAIDRTPIESIEQYDAASAKADLEKGMLVFFNRQGTISYALIRMPQDN